MNSEKRFLSVDSTHSFPWRAVSSRPWPCLVYCLPRSFCGRWNSGGMQRLLFGQRHVNKCNTQLLSLPKVTQIPRKWARFRIFIHIMHPTEEITPEYKTDCLLKTKQKCLSKPHKGTFRGSGLHLCIISSVEAYRWVIFYMVNLSGWNARMSLPGGYRMFFTLISPALSNI